MSSKKNIAVVIRVFSRIEDTLGLIHIIREKWTSHNYTIFVSHNGRKSGFVFPENSLQGVTLIEVEENLGHLGGAGSLVYAAFDHITEDFDYAIFIESDFWVLDENLILEPLTSDFDVACTIWVESHKSMGVDFFILKQSYLAKNKELLNWGKSSHAERIFPENIVAEYYVKTQAKVHIIQSLRPIHVPKLETKLMRILPVKDSYDNRRFRLFPKASVVTHHIENIPNGIVTKKQIANALAQEEIFKDVTPYTLRFMEKNIQQIARFFPQSSWFRKEYWKSFSSK